MNRRASRYSNLYYVQECPDGVYYEENIPQSKPQPKHTFNCEVTVWDETTFWSGDKHDR